MLSILNHDEESKQKGWRIKEECWTQKGLLQFPSDLLSFSFLKRVVIKIENP